MRRSRWYAGTGIVLAVLALGGMFVYSRLSREQAVPYFPSDEEHFLYGSIGTEADGIPFWIWLVLPRIFPEHLPAPGGYASLGLFSRDANEVPVGFSVATVGVPRVGMNCATCHTATFRAEPDDVPTMYPAAAGHQAGAQEYVRFLVACANDPRFTAGTILDEIAKNTRLSLIDQLLYRFVIIPGTRRRILRFGDATAWMGMRPDWGRGRADQVNALKFTLFQQPMDQTVGTADAMPLWNLREREGASFHRDGLATTLREAVQSSALAFGSPRGWVEGDAARWDASDPRAVSGLRRVANYIADLKPPSYPLTVDQTLADAGAAVFNAECANCHAPAGARTGSVIPIAEVGTDRARLDAWTADAAAALNEMGSGQPWQFSTFRKTDGYAALPLDGVWLTAPYLHNGSVPTLADLLEPAEARPRRFVVGSDLYDSARVGFVSQGPEAERAGTVFDVTRAGNGNGGHSYGTMLPPGDKRALLEYLKTR